jgi:pimeloyl-ACP methyl ester carboxylesterase
MMVTAEAGHLPQIDRPEIVNDAILNFAGK